MRKGFLASCSKIYSTIDNGGVKPYVMKLYPATLLYAVQHVRQHSIAAIANDIDPLYSLRGCVVRTVQDSPDAAISIKSLDLM